MLTTLQTVSATLATMRLHLDMARSTAGDAYTSLPLDPDGQPLADIVGAISGAAVAVDLALDLLADAQSKVHAIID